MSPPRHQNMSIYLCTSQPPIAASTLTWHVHISVYYSTTPCRLHTVITCQYLCTSQPPLVASTLTWHVHISVYFSATTCRRLHTVITCLYLCVLLSHPLSPPHCHNMPISLCTCQPPLVASTLTWDAHISVYLSATTCRLHTDLTCPYLCVLASHPLSPPHWLDMPISLFKGWYQGSDPGDRH